MTTKPVLDTTPRAMSEIQKAQLLALLRSGGPEIIELTEAYRNHCRWEDGQKLARELTLKRFVAAMEGL